MMLSSWPSLETATSSLATTKRKRKISADRSRIAFPAGLTRPFTSRATPAPSTAASSRLSMRFALPVSISWVCSPRKTRTQSQLLLRHPRIEDRNTASISAVRLLTFLCRAGSHPARFHGLRRRSTSGPQETRYGDGCWRRIRRSDGHAQRGPADRHSARADHYFHGHHAAYSQGLGHARSSALAEPAAERRAREQNRGRPDCHERQT